MENLSPEDDEAWHEREGVPRFEDPFIQQFLRGRDALIHEENQQRSDRVFRENLSPVAEEACAIVDQIRFEESQTLWTAEYEDEVSESRPDAVIYPGMMFSLAKERMERSKLWRIVRKMPKGALLHCHFEAMVEVAWVLEQAFGLDGIGIRCDRSLESERVREDHKVHFSFAYSPSLAADYKALDTQGIWSASYKSDTLIPLSVAADTFPTTGRAGFIAWVTSRCTITAQESICHHHGTAQVWSKFLSTFLILRTLIYIPSIFPLYVRRLLHQLHQDNVRWADIRALFAGEGADRSTDDYAAQFSTFQDVLAAYKASPEGAAFWGCRIIWTAYRGLPKRAIIAAMAQCVELKKRFPALIAGFDLVGPEDAGRPLADLVPEFFWLRKRCAEEGVELPLFLHAGETLGTGTSTDENLFDAVLLGARRLGHAFSAYKHPLLLSLLTERRILVESCPISNEVLRLAGSVLAHPLPALLARGVPCSLSNDDPAILGQATTGLSHDFWQALQGWESLGLAGLASLAENSVRWAAFEDQDAKTWLSGVKLGAAGKGLRAERLREWIRDWEAFCGWVVKEFGADIDLEEDHDDD